MAENDLTIPQQPKKATGNLLQAFHLIIRPRQTIQRIITVEKAVWLFPLLLFMGSALILTIITNSVENKTVLNVDPAFDMEYYPEDYQEQYDQVMTENNGIVTTIIFPVLGKWVGTWSNWALLSVLLMVLLLAFGHPMEWQKIFNLTAWCTLPYVLRDLIQMVYLLASSQLINKPGLSGFMAEGAIGFSQYLVGLLALIDIYLIWQLVLVMIGVYQRTQMTVIKSVLAVFIAGILFISLRAVPVYIIGKLSTVFASGMFYF